MWLCISNNHLKEKEGGRGKKIRKKKDQIRRLLKVFIAGGYFHVNFVPRSWTSGPVEMETLGSAKGFMGFVSYVFSLVETLGHGFFCMIACS